MGIRGELEGMGGGGQTCFCVDVCIGSQATCQGGRLAFDPCCDSRFGAVGRAGDHRRRGVGRCRVNQVAKVAEERVPLCCST